MLGPFKSYFKVVNVLKYQLPVKKSEIMIIWAAFGSKADENMQLKVTKPRNWVR